MGGEQLARVFDPGFSNKGGRMGASLGLVITSQIVREHHGELHIESQPGAGTTVKISLPMGIGAGETPAP
jgi:signal transduction histidine kinase